jgi:hypothetical protein
MQHVHRSTLWRRKQKAASRLGRKRIHGADDKFNLVLLAKVFAWLARRGGAAGYAGGKAFVPMNQVMAVRSAKDIRLAQKHIEQNWRCDEMAVPVGLLVVSAWDAFHVDSRRRERSAKARLVGQLSPQAKLAVNQIARTTRVTKAEAEKLVRQALAKSEPWVFEFMGRDSDEPTKYARASCNLPCPSRYFRISRRMVSYWRRQEEARKTIASEMQVVARHFLRDAMGLRLRA